MIVFAAVTASAQQVPLLCPPAPAGRPCEAFHYHVQMYRPDTKGFTEISAGPQFASQAACDRARDQAMAANAKVVDYFRTVKEQQYPADRFGACHCDMTFDKSSATYLGDAQRMMQLRTAEEIRLRVRERLLDNKVPSDSQIIRGLYAAAPMTPILGAPKLVPMPNAAPPAIITAAEDLKPTRTLDTTKASVAALDLPLIDITPVVPAAVPAATTTEQTTPVPPAAEVALPPVQAVVEPPVEETKVEPQPAVIEAPHEEVRAEEETESVEDTAEQFISYETQRIQNVLRASAAISDEKVKTKIFEASMERIQLLSNLRLLIEGSGTRSRLAVAARDAQTEAARLALVGQLFGEGVKPHWAPHDASEVVFNVDAAVASAPERALRDSTGRFTLDQKKNALYLVLAQTQPTEDQRLWLSTVVEGFLR